MANETAIEFVEVFKSFEAQPVLKGLDLRVPRSEITTILGPSGCGKSVTLKHVIGIERADEGKVVVAGYDMERIRHGELIELRKRIGVLFQSSALFDSMTVKENVAFGLRMHTRMSEEEIAERVHICLDAVRLAGTEAKMPVELSGGMRKRAALARAIAMEPDFILYDEPTTGLDPNTSSVVGDYILKLQSELNVTSVVVTHDMPLARRVSDRIALLYDGKAVVQGAMEDVEASGNEFFELFIQGKLG
ncbi:MAG: ATP-binding cassette domain-containing protein [Gemmatimonadetes bacterium]|nr:ATP-binding cassette domain-containing protein [Gemmatimonadota bacterium]MXX12697.1 ATP-binding cassette domain-containing protein [Gemmatimonadota bacterium]MXZ10339.1 ATP-binding cassette domain-containing protein [Gemmatimonadota bacterium]MYB55152.1 ATP-binding cassette domain-containing protein [Gemmatimonadota bacterium]MYD59617.1 ATP-binding cassette domain-containing protein [Gemmatimonadota bacterium]